MVMKKSFIPASLRPYITGSEATSETTSSLGSEKYDEITSLDYDVIIIGNEADTTINYFVSFCREKSIRFLFIDNHLLSRSGWVSLCWMFLETITEDRPGPSGLFLRNFISPESPNYYLANLLNDILHIVQSKIKVINSLLNDSLNSSKPNQYVSIGGQTCETVQCVSTSLRRCRGVSPTGESNSIVKSISDIRSIVTFSTQVNSKAPSDSILLIQPFIEGRNIRIHVVEEQAICHFINSNLVDYRYDEKMEVEIGQVPEEVLNWCISATKSEGLKLSGIDFILRDNTYYCLEINPFPAYNLFEEACVNTDSKQISELILKAFLSK